MPSRSSRMSVPQVSSRLANTSEASMASRRRGVATGGFDAQIPVSLRLDYDRKRTSHWLERVLAEAREYCSKKDLEGAIQR